MHVYSLHQIKKEYADNSKTWTMHTAHMRFIFVMQGINDNNFYAILAISGFLTSLMPTRPTLFERDGNIEFFSRYHWENPSGI